ncbi:MAG: DUF2782 domain-containing protein [Gallionella sp.]
MRAFYFTGTAIMRFLSLLLLSSFSCAALAAQTDKLASLPPPPALETGPDTSVSDEPAVTIIKKEQLTVEEYRSGGRLYMIKITPKFGPAYYLVDDRGDGKFARQESLDTGFRPPQWIIHRF